MHLKQQPDMSIRRDSRTSIKHDQSNLLLIANMAFIKKELAVIRPHFKSDMASINCNSLFNDHWNVEVDEFEYEIDSYSKMCCLCVGVEKNANHTNAQKERLLW